ncbi:hypothetical protein L21SP5_01646 [Salinivirga cyanobacteriivorans]|uniref:Uncharacterized protein n=1 Tax=Salinivirga cyanobacteriivorans TaxID=1307839 RepID=A0A0S2HYT5_9BACT|nr:hypothetical protein L21SP5_01646 [Salinivirga cyanobacteriivorans]
MIALSYKAIIIIPLFIFLSGTLGDAVQVEPMDSGLPRHLIEQLEKVAFEEPEEKNSEAHVISNFSTPVFRSDQVGIFDEKVRLGVLIPEYQGFSPQDYR